jgi:AraC-like DNA-binding protein
LIESLPLNIDVFALIIFLGTVQGIFLSFFFLSKENRLVKANIYLGLLILVSSLLSFDILISYTNFMFKILHLVDSTEPLNLLIGPLFYLYVKSKLDESKIKKVYYHFLPSLIYFFYVLLFLAESIEVKYNAYIDQYHPEMNFVEVLNSGFNDPLLLKSFINELTILSITVYLIFSVIKIYRAQKNNRGSERLIKFLWIDAAFMTAILLIIVFVKITFAHDLGDYIIIIAITIFIYSISFKVIRDSLFFHKEEKKYKKSVLDEETKIRILNKIYEQMNKKYYLNTSPSLPELSKKINTSPNYVSQVINEKLNMTFLELINKYRIEEAKKLLLDKNLNETIEGIGYSLGYNSKSTFHSAFKKATGQTPSEFKNSQK